MVTLVSDLLIYSNSKKERSQYDYWRFKMALHYGHSCKAHGPETLREWLLKKLQRERRGVKYTPSNSRMLSTLFQAEEAIALLFIIIIISFPKRSFFTYSHMQIAGRHCTNLHNRNRPWYILTYSIMPEHTVLILLDTSNINSYC